jgi:membrane associated rhomboid family serine protease
MSQSPPPRRRHPLEAGPQRPTPPPAPGGPEQPQQTRVVLTAAAARPLVMFALIAVNVAVFAVGFLLPDVGDWLFLNGASRAHEVLIQGQYYRLFTAMFLHAGLAHIFFNMYALYIFGSILEPLLGHLRFAVIYLLGGLTGSLLSVLLGNPNPPLAQVVFAGASVGASGAVFAVFGAEMVFLYRHRAILGARGQAQLRNLLVLLGINLLLGIASTAPGTAVSIDNWAHLGGLGGGLALMWLIGPRFAVHADALRPGLLVARDETLTNRRESLAVVYALGLVGVLLIATFLAR